MAGRISDDDVAHVARLARLGLNAHEVSTAVAELGAVLDHFADIDALDLDNVEPMAQPYPLSNVVRDDFVTASLDRDEVLAQAPEVVDGRFAVPPILGDGS